MDSKTQFLGSPDFWVGIALLMLVVVASQAIIWVGAAFAGLVFGAGCYALLVWLGAWILQVDAQVEYFYMDKYDKMSRGFSALFCAALWPVSVLVLTENWSISVPVYLIWFFSLFGGMFSVRWHYTSDRPYRLANALAEVMSGIGVFTGVLAKWNLRNLALYVVVLISIAVLSVLI